MQRNILAVVIVAVLAGAAYLTYQQRDDLTAYLQRWRTSGKLPWLGATPTPEPASAAPTVPMSRLPPRGEPGVPQSAAPGTYYITKRKKIVTPAGVQAVNPGELVKLLQRLPDGRLRVTIENADFIVLPSEVTADLETAREAERHYLESPHPVSER